MVHREFVLQRDSRQELFARSWEPEGTRRGAIAIVHGFGEHTGRYMHLGGSLAESGYAVCGVDLPGHGKTKGRQGHSSGVEALDSLERLVLETKRRYAGARVFLYGHSWGGALAMRYAMEGGAGLTGIIATSPLIRLARPAPGWKLAAARVLNKVLPSVTMSNPLDPAELTRDARAVQAVRNDPLYHNKASARLGWDIIQNGLWFDSQGNGFPVPLLVMLGTEDKIVDMSAGAALARRLSGNVTLKMWEGKFHELHNEPERDEIISYVLEWMGRYAA